MRSEMGRRARAMLDAQFTRRQALERWRDLQRVGEPRQIQPVNRKRDRFEDK